MSQVMVQVKDLRKRFGDREILRGIDLSATAGSVLGVLGPNGAGKSTTIGVNWNHVKWLEIKVFMVLEQ